MKKNSVSIKAKLVLSFSLLIVFVVASSGAGIFGIKNLSDDIHFVTGAAWDAADGSMEGTIGIEAEMLAISRIVADVLSNDLSRIVASFN